jgi:hypothetical protein
MGSQLTTMDSRIDVKREKRTPPRTISIEMATLEASDEGSRHVGRALHFKE